MELRRRLLVDGVLLVVRELAQGAAAPEEGHLGSGRRVARGVLFDKSPSAQPERWEDGTDPVRTRSQVERHVRSRFFRIPKLFFSLTCLFSTGSGQSKNQPWREQVNVQCCTINFLVAQRPDTRDKPISVGAQLCLGVDPNESTPANFQILEPPLRNE